MASGGGAAAGGGPTTPGAPPGKMVPRDIVVMQSMLREMGITKFDARILVQMHEYVYRQVTSVAEEARVYSVYAKKKSIDNEDMRLAIKVLGTGKNYTTVPARDLLLDLAKSKNSVPLPLLKASSGLRLPPDRFCLTQPNYRLQFFRKSIASSSLMSSSRFLATPPIPGSQQPLFKTPSGLPLRTVVVAGNAGEPDPKKPKLS